MSHRREPDRRRVLMILAVVVVVVAVRVALDTAGAPTARAGLGLDALAALAAVAAAANVARRAPDARRRRAWVLTAAAPLAWVVAPVVWLADGSPLLADVFRMVAVLLVGSSWWFASRSGGALARIRLVVDGSIGAAAFLVMGWNVVLHEVWRATRETEGVLGVTLPVATVGTTVMCAVMTLSEMPRGRRARSTHFLVGTLLLASSDIAVAVGLPAVWAAGWTAYALTIHTQVGTTQRVTRVPTRGRLVYLPYVLVLPAAVVVAVEARAAAVTPVQVAGCVVVVALLLVRQHVTLVENDRLVLRLEEAERLLRHRATHDALTGLPGRAVLHEALAAAALEQDVRPAPVALAFIDLDRFKDVNDRYGHASGDAVLVEVSRRLTRTLREYGTDALAARMGGDEFAVLLRGAAAAQGSALAARLTTAVDGPLDVGTQRLLIGASVGVATVDGGPFAPSDLLHEADLAMYEVKHARPSPAIR